MGTSDRWSGPRGPGWVQANHRFRSALANAEDGGSDSTDQIATIVHDIGGHYLAALHAAMRQDRDTFGLRQQMVSAGHRLLDVLERLDSSEPPFPTPPGADHAGVLLGFVDAIAGTGVGITDGAVRRAAARAGATLLDSRPQLHARATDPAGSSPGGIDDALVCLLYRLLFPDIIGEFVLAAIIEGVELDTSRAPGREWSEEVAGSIAHQVRTLIPDPCQTVFGGTPRRQPASRVARDLVEDAVDRALGLPDEEDDHDHTVAALLSIRAQPTDSTPPSVRDEDLRSEHP